MNARTKLIIMADHATLAVVEKQGGGNEGLIHAMRIPRAELHRLAAQVATLQAGQLAVFYGDGGGNEPGELPLQTSTPNHT